MRTIPILMYHQIDEFPLAGTAFRNLTVPPTLLFKQLRFLHSIGYRGLSMRELEPYLSDQKQGKVFGITFDDGYANNLLHALPILKKFQFSATCYGVSHQIGGWNTWDKLRDMPQKPLMDLEQWQEWLEQGMEIGSHTCDHVNLCELDDEAAILQIQQSKFDLERMLRTEVRHFCYPYGSHTPHHVDMVKAAGYVTATTTRRGRIHLNKGLDLLQLPRVLVNHRTSRWHLLLKFFSTYEDSRA